MLQGIRVVGRAGDGGEAVALVESLRSCCRLLDVRMPGRPGAGVIRRVTRTAAELICVVYSGFGDNALLSEVLDAGAARLRAQDAPLVTLVRALETVSGGRMYVDPGLADALIRPRRHRTSG